MVSTQSQIGEYEEGQSTKAIEKRTAQLPSALFLMLAGGSVLGSLALQLRQRREESLFVGQWAPTFLILGLYNKVVKTVGHTSHEGFRTH